MPAAVTLGKNPGGPFYMLAIGLVRRLGLVVLAGILAARVAAAAESSFDVDVTVDLMMPMRDGVRLATDIYRPMSGGQVLGDRRPVVLIRTPYNKGAGKSSEGRY